jgi:hypothetical protein
MQKLEARPEAMEPGLQKFNVSVGETVPSLFSDPRLVYPGEFAKVGGRGIVATKSTGACLGMLLFDRRTNEGLLGQFEDFGRFDSEASGFGKSLTEAKRMFRHPGELSCYLTGLRIRGGEGQGQTALLTNETIADRRAVSETLRLFGIRECNTFRYWNSGSFGYVQSLMVHAVSGRVFVHEESQLEMYELAHAVFGDRASLLFERNAEAVRPRAGK